MKIAIFTDTFLPLVDGVVSATINIAMGLAKKGHKVIIVAPKFSNNPTLPHRNIKVIRMPSISLLFYADYRTTIPFDLKVIKALKDEKVDLIHFQAPWTIGAQAIISTRILNLPLVGTFHTFHVDMDYLKHAKLDHPFFQRFAWKYELAFYNRCDLVTCPSHITRMKLIENGCKRKIKFISNGIDKSAFDNSRSKIVKKKYGKGSRLLLFVGRIAYEKNIGFLLDCFSVVAQKVNNVNLLIVGDGPQFRMISDKVRSLGLSKRVIMTGKIPHNKFIRSGIIGACDLFVTASKTENQPMTVLEAQANGLVCVGVRSQGMPDLIKDMVNGRLVKPDDKKAFSDAIITLLKDSSLYTRLKRGTIKEIQKHDLNNVIDEWEKTYSNLIRSRKKSSR